MDVRDFDYDLPSELIAQEPSPQRGGSRLLCLDRRTGALTDTVVTALPGRLQSGDLLVLNNTRVFPARLLGRRTPGGGRVECLLIGRVAEGNAAIDRGHQEYWEALVHPGQKLKPGARIVFDGSPSLQGEVLERRFFGRRLMRLWCDDGVTVDEAIDVIGHVPLPPYIKRPDREADRDRYQTVFASRRGSVAAPTAGLHFTPGLVDACAAGGVEIVEITLHVGYGTFEPVRVERVDDHHVEPEHYEIGEQAAVAITRALADRRRVIAVGTTTTRALEGVTRDRGHVVAGSGTTDVFIRPGFTFQVVSGLMTNFHLPRSSLLMLVSAFAGRERILDAYRHAVAAGYRFYSYGDAMLIT